MSATIWPVFRDFSSVRAEQSRTRCCRGERERRSTNQPRRDPSPRGLGIAVPAPGDLAGARAEGLVVSTVQLRTAISGPIYQQVRLLLHRLGGSLLVWVWD
jgi:hypothetical protein